MFMHGSQHLADLCVKGRELGVHFCVDVAAVTCKVDCRVGLPILPDTVREFANKMGLVSPLRPCLA